VRPGPKLYVPAGALSREALEALDHGIIRYEPGGRPEWVEPAPAAATPDQLAAWRLDAEVGE
jgi:hypothetical protein